MRKLVLAAFAASLLGGAVTATPAAAACWRIPHGWRCVHRRVVIVRHHWVHYHHPYWHHPY